MGKALGWIDSHCHLTCADLIEEAQGVRQRALEAGVVRMMIVCCRLEEAKAALKMKAEDARFDVAVGFHPSDLRDFTEEDWHKLETLVYNENVTAIGEIGLDYYWEENPPRAFQKEVMARQMALAEQLDLPVVIHDRDAHGDCMDMVRAFPGVRGEFHCYSGSVEDARILLDRGWYLGFGGALTFKNARKAPEVAAYAPLDRLLLETDSPYLAPVPFRGKRNDSRYLPYVAERIAAIKGIRAEEAERITWENALRFFALEGTR